MVQHAAESFFSDSVWNVLIGIVGSLLSLWLLFGIKPSLRLTLEVGRPGGQWYKRNVPVDSIGKEEAERTSPWVECTSTGPLSGEPWPQGACGKCGRNEVHYRVEIENLGLAKVVEVECRLMIIRKNPSLGTRELLLEEKLLELSGKWYEARRNEHELENHTGDRFFHLLLPCHVVTPDELASGAHFLLQVWSKHGFTNFGRVHKLRIRRRASGGVFERFLVDDPDARRRRRAVLAWAATQIANGCSSGDVRQKRGMSKQSGGTSRS